MQKPSGKPGIQDVSPALEPRYPAAVHGWTIIVMLMFASLVSYLDRQILNLLVDPIRHDLQISDAQIGLLQGFGFSVFYSLAGLWFGGLVDRHNRLRIVAIAIVLWSATTIYCGFANSFMQLFIGRVGVAVGEAALMPAAYSMISDLFHPHRRGRAAGVFGTGMAMGNGLSMMVSSLFVAWLDGPTIAAMPDFLPHVQWKLVFIAVGLVGMPVALMLLLIREPKRMGATISGQSSIPDVLRFVAANKAAFAGLLCSSAALLSIGNGLSAWAPTIMIRQFGETPVDAGFAYGLSTLAGGVAGPLLMGWLSDRLAMNGKGAARMRTYLIGGPLSAAGAMMVALAAGPAMLLAGNVVVMLCVHGFAMLLYTATQDISPVSMRGKVVAVTGVFINVVGLAMGPLLVALAGEWATGMGLPLTVGYGMMALPLIAVGTVIAAISLRSFGETERRMAEVAA